MLKMEHFLYHLLYYPSLNNTFYEACTRGTVMLHHHFMGWTCWINTVGNRWHDDGFMMSSLVVAMLWVAWYPFILWVPIIFCHMEKIDSDRATMIIAILLFLSEAAISKFFPLWIENKIMRPGFISWEATFISIHSLFTFCWSAIWMMLVDWPYQDS